MKYLIYEVFNYKKSFAIVLYVLMTHETCQHMLNSIFLPHGFQDEVTYADTL